MSIFRHVLMVRFRDDATENQIEELYRGLARLPHVIEEIERYDFGPDQGLGEGNPDMALVADFDSEAAWRAYQKHPEHLILAEDLVRPVAAEMIRVQYLVEN